MKEPNYRKTEGEPAVTHIRLDDRTRKQILTDLGVQGDLDWIPEVIHITRVDHRVVGLPDDMVRPNRWVLVMV